MTVVGSGGSKAGSIEQWSGTDLALLHPTHITHGMSACMTVLLHSSFFKTSFVPIYLPFSLSHIPFPCNNTWFNIPCNQQNVTIAVSIPVKIISSGASIIVYSVRARARAYVCVWNQMSRKQGYCSNLVV